MSATRLRIVSHFPGRLRVRAEPFRDPAFGLRLAEQLGAEAGVTAATASSLTGSLLVVYEASTVQLPWLVQLIVQLGGLEGLEVDHDGKPWRPAGPVVRHAVERWNGAIIGATRGRVDARTAIPGTLASLGALKLLFGNRRLPEWYDLLFWSYVTFSNLNPPDDGQSS